MRRIQLDEQPVETVSHNPAISKRVMLRPGDFFPITQFAQAVFPPGVSAPGHVHDDMGEVFLCVAGAGEIEVDGVAYALEPGTCVAVRRGERHEVRNTGEGDLVITYFGVRQHPPGTP